MHEGHQARHEPRRPLPVQRVTRPGGIGPFVQRVEVMGYDGLFVPDAVRDGFELVDRITLAVPATDFVTRGITP